MEFYELENENNENNEIENKEIVNKEIKDLQHENKVLPLVFDFDKESESNSKINEILAFRNVDSDLIFSFIFEHLATLESFSYEDLDLLCRKYNKFGELELSLQLIQDFLNAELLVELSFRNYVFKL